MSEIISLRVTNEEKELLDNASKMYKGGLSSMIKKIVFEHLEDEFDLKIIEDYEKQKREGTLQLLSWDDFVKEAGIASDEI